MTTSPARDTILAFVWDTLQRAEPLRAPALREAERSRLGFFTRTAAPALVRNVALALRSGLFPGGEARADALLRRQGQAAALRKAAELLGELARELHDAALREQGGAAEEAMQLVIEAARGRQASAAPSLALGLQALALAPATAILRAQQPRRPAPRRRRAAKAAPLIAELRARNAAQLQRPTEALDATPLRRALRAVLSARGEIAPGLDAQIAAADPPLLLRWIAEAAAA